MVDKKFCFTSEILLILKGTHTGHDILSDTVYLTKSLCQEE